MNRKKSISEESDEEVKFIRLKELLVMCGMSRSTVYQAIKEGRFPAPVKIGLRSTAWVEREVQAWAKERIRARSAGPIHSGGIFTHTKG